MYIIIYMTLYCNHYNIIIVWVFKKFYHFPRSKKDILEKIIFRDLQTLVTVEMLNTL